jgi:uncharacterized repeat protein (TIGR03803 family)
MIHHPTFPNRRGCLGLALGLATDLALARGFEGLASPPDAQPGDTRGTRYRVIHHFAPGEGARPLGGIIIASDGHGYGTNTSQGRYGFGTLFRFDDAHELEVLHDFAGPPDDGSGPIGALVEAGDGALYGVTTFGGSGVGGHADGIVYRVTLGGDLTVLHSFPSAPGDGDFSEARLLLASDGLLYGTTYTGGRYGRGTVFRTDLAGNVTILWSFDPKSRQKHPLAGLIEGPDGRLYGTSYGGGTQNPGGIYSLGKDGSDPRSLHVFDWATEGAEPFTELTLGFDGSLYGGTRWGGATDSGTVFRLHPSGRLTVLHNFDDTVDGWGVGSPLLEIRPGVFLGTTVNGGPVFPGHGTAFMIRSDGRFRLLHAFGLPGRGAPDGAAPYGPLTVCPGGAVIGVCTEGGKHQQGTAWELLPTSA